MNWDFIIKLANHNDVSIEISKKEIKIGDFTWFLYSGVIDEDVLSEVFYHASGHFIKRNLELERT